MVSGPERRQETKRFREMRILRQNAPALVLGAIAVVFLWLLIGTITSDSHFVCTEGARTRDAPAGECFDGFTVNEPSPLRTKIVYSVVWGGIGAVFAYGAVKSWKPPNANSAGIAPIWTEGDR